MANPYILNAATDGEEIKTIFPIYIKIHKTKFFTNYLNDAIYEYNRYAHEFNEIYPNGIQIINAGGRHKMYRYKVHPHHQLGITMYKMKNKAYNNPEIAYSICLSHTDKYDNIDIVSHPLYGDQFCSMSGAKGKTYMKPINNNNLSGLRLPQDIETIRYSGSYPDDENPSEHTINWHRQRNNSLIKAQEFHLPILVVSWFGARENKMDILGYYYVSDYQEYQANKFVFYLYRVVSLKNL